MNCLFVDFGFVVFGFVVSVMRENPASTVLTDI